MSEKTPITCPHCETARTSRSLSQAELIEAVRLAEFAEPLGIKREIVRLYRLTARTSGDTEIQRWLVAPSMQEALRIVDEQDALPELALILRLELISEEVVEWESDT